MNQGSRSTLSQVTAIWRFAESLLSQINVSVSHEIQRKILWPKTSSLNQNSRPTLKNVIVIWILTWSSKFQADTTLFTIDLESWLKRQNCKSLNFASNGFKFKFDTEPFGWVATHWNFNSNIPSPHVSHTFPWNLINIFLTRIW